MEDAYVGIDVAIAKHKRLPIVICTKRQGRLLPLPLAVDPPLLPPAGIGNAGVLDEAKVKRFAEEAAAYLQAISARERLVIRRIAIDAPREPASADAGRRQSERALDRAGISCFATPTAEQFVEIIGKARKHLAAGRPVARLPHANKLWMLAGFEMFRTLGQVAECREVYPYAIVVALAASGGHKSGPSVALEQLQAASRYTGWPRPETAERELRGIGWGADHDRVDAYLAAWVASLEDSDLHGFGVPPVDVIWVPHLAVRKAAEPMPIRAQVPESRRPSVGSESHRPSGLLQRQALPCPACNQHLFRAWPLGWDAHAGYRCSGVSGASPEQRKAEFKRRFGHLFRNGS